MAGVAVLAMVKIVKFGALAPYVFASGNVVVDPDWGVEVSRGCIAIIL
jgi:hypothetical protein